MLKFPFILFMFLLVILVASCSGKSVPDNSDGKEGSRSLKEYSTAGNGSLSRDLVVQERVLSNKLNEMDTQRNQQDQDIWRKIKTSTLNRSAMSGYNKTDLKKLLKKAYLRHKRSPDKNATFSPSYVVFLLELILVLCSNVFAHMVRTYKNSVPHIKLNIIIIISHYIVELSNLFMIFQVGFASNLICSMYSNNWTINILN